jgi:hypothetical protein
VLDLSLGHLSNNLCQTLPDGHVGLQAHSTAAEQSNAGCSIPNNNKLRPTVQPDPAKSIYIFLGTFGAGATAFLKKEPTQAPYEEIHC